MMVAVAMKRTIVSLLLILCCLLGVCSMSSCSEEYPSLDYPPSAMEVGETCQITVDKRILKTTTSYKQGTYSAGSLFFVSEDPHVATIDQTGLLTAINPGTTKIVISLKKSPEKQIDFYVTVKAPVQETTSSVETGFGESSAA